MPVSTTSATATTSTTASEHICQAMYEGDSLEHERLAYEKALRVQSFVEAANERARSNWNKAFIAAKAKRAKAKAATRTRELARSRSAIVANKNNVEVPPAEECQGQPDEFERGLLKLQEIRARKLHVMSVLNAVRSRELEKRDNILFGVEIDAPEAALARVDNENANNEVKVTRKNKRTASKKTSSRKRNATKLLKKQETFDSADYS